MRLKVLANKAQLSTRPHVSYIQTPTLDATVNELRMEPLQMNNFPPISSYMHLVLGIEGMLTELVFDQVLVTSW